MTGRALIEIRGEDRLTFLQGIVTQDVHRLAEEIIQFALLLSPQGKVLHEMFLVHRGEAILIDISADCRDLFIKRLNMYKLRAKVTIADASAQWQVAYAAGEGLPDPRHPGLPRRRYVPVGEATGIPQVEHTRLRLALGIPECGADFAPDTVVAMDAGYDLLHGISFTKGCYVGQEVTARMHYKNIARRGFYQLWDGDTLVRLALLRFDEVDAAQGSVTVDGRNFRATLPAWMQPKYAQFLGHKGEG